MEQCNCSDGKSIFVMQESHGQAGGGLPAQQCAVEVCGSTRGYTRPDPYPRVWVGYGYEVHGSGIPVFYPLKKPFFMTLELYRMFFYFFFFSERERDSLHVVVRPSICRLSVCLWSVTFVPPIQG